MTTRGEGHLLPVGETPTAYEYLEEMVAGKIVSRVEWQPEPIPKFWSGFALQLRTSEVLFVYGMPATEGPYRWMIVLRWLEPQRLTKTLDRQLRSGDFGQGDLDMLQRRIVGQTLRHVRSFREPTRWGGKRMEIVFTDGACLKVEALPRGTVYPASEAADLDVQWVGPERTFVGFGKAA